MAVYFLLNLICEDFDFAGNYYISGVIALLVLFWAGLLTYLTVSSLLLHTEEELLIARTLVKKKAGPNIFLLGFFIKLTVIQKMASTSDYFIPFTLKRTGIFPMGIRVK